MPSSTHKVLAVENLTSKTFRLVLERGDYNFKAGQCINIGLPGTAVNREYSSYSSETDTKLSFLIREVEDGTVSTKLRKLNAGDQVELDGPYGEFCIRNPDDGRNYFFVGTGTGIAPFHCFVKSYPQLSYKIIHGVQKAEEQYDRADYTPGQYVGCLSQESSGDFSGRVTNYLQEHAVEQEGVYYLCGNRAMINDVYDLLRERGVNGSNIITETFF